VNAGPIIWQFLMLLVLIGWYGYLRGCDGSRSKKEVRLSLLAVIAIGVALFIIIFKLTSGGRA
jgi:hypothetical protein